MLKENEIIDQIQEVRKNNNKLWMDIVRLCMKLSPIETKKIMGMIQKNDVAVTKLTKKLSKSWKWLYNISIINNMKGGIRNGHRN